MKDKERILGVVRKYKSRTGDFPTVRRVGRTLRWSFSRVEQAVQDSDALVMTSYPTSADVPVGDHFVETY